MTSDQPTTDPRGGRRRGRKGSPLRPVLAGLAVLAVGVPAVWLTSGPAPHRVPDDTAAVATLPAGGRMPSAAPAPGGLTAVPPAEPRRLAVHLPPEPKGSGKARTPRPATPSPSKSRPGRQTVRPLPSRSRADCARRFPGDPIRQGACEALLAQVGK